jgi:hypothetical protein
VPRWQTGNPSAGVSDPYGRVRKSGCRQTRPFARQSAALTRNEIERTPRLCHDFLGANHHKHERRKEGEPKSKLRSLAVPIILIGHPCVRSAVGVPFFPPHRPQKPSGGDSHCWSGRIPLDTKPPEGSLITYHLGVRFVKGIISNFKLRHSAPTFMFGKERFSAMGEGSVLIALFSAGYRGIPEQCVPQDLRLKVPLLIASWCDFQ